MSDSESERQNDIAATRPDAFVLELCLNRPGAGNRVTRAMAERLIAELAAAYMSDTKLVVIRASGDDFCLGSEAPVAQPGASLAQNLYYEHILKLIQRAPYFSIACVQGQAIDFGADIAVCCDWRLASSNSEFCFSRHRQPDAALSSKRLADIIGGFRAFDTLVRRATLSAEKALSNGLLTDMVEAEQCAPFLTEFRQTLASIEKNSIVILRDAIGATDGSADIERVVRSSAIVKHQNV